MTKNEGEVRSEAWKSGSFDHGERLTGGAGVARRDGEAARREDVAATVSGAHVAPSGTGAVRAVAVLGLGRLVYQAGPRPKRGGERAGEAVWLFDGEASLFGARTRAAGSTYTCLLRRVVLPPVETSSASPVK